MSTLDPSRVVFLSGAGLSAASGVPTFRDADGLWEGHRVEEVATPEAWFADPTKVARFYDERRIAVEGVSPNAGHLALARLQQQWGPDRVVLITQNIDGLLSEAGASEVIEMHGALRLLRCENSADHERVAIAGAQAPETVCPHCGGRLRPDVVWFGEMPYELDRIGRAVDECTTFVSVGTSGLVYPAAGLVARARQRGAYCLEVNPDPSGGRFDRVIHEGSEIALPGLVDGWLRGER